MRHTSSIGLHLGKGWASGVQLRPGGRLRAWMRVETGVDDPDAETVARIAKILDRRGFEGRRVTLCAPDDDTISALLEVPDRSSGAPVDQIVRSELARLARSEAGGLCAASWDLPAHARQREGASVLGVALDEDAGERLCAMFDDAGLQVVAIDARFCAVARACGSITREQELAGIVEICPGASRIIVLLRGTIVYERSLPSCGLDGLIATLVRELRIDEEIAVHLLLHEGLCERFGDERDGWVRLGAAREAIASWAENLARECETALRFSRERYRCEEASVLVLAGRGAQTPGLASFLEPIVGTRTHRWSPCDALGDGAPDEPALATALGLAMRYD